MGFSSQDCDDIAQQIAIEIGAFTFDPARANGASPEAVFAVIVKRQMQCAARRRSRYRRRLERYMQGQHAVATGVESKHEMELDVRMVVERLPRDLQRVCELLSEGESTAGVAKALNCGWHTAQRMVASIHERFEKLRLNEWLGD